MWHPGSPQHGLHPALTTALILATLLTPGVCDGCDVEACLKAYTAWSGSVEAGATHAYCSQLKASIACVREQRVACRYDLTHKTTERMFEHKYHQHNCSAVLGGEVAPVAPRPSPTVSTAAEDDACVYQGSSAPAHCGLFGDPHLKTFNGSYMTCRVQGAWPLLNTPHLAVQVTNQPVGPGLHATATSKVTVIIKGHERCASERTYEASSESLPKAFVDGTTWSGGLKVRPHVKVTEVRPGEHVLITVSYVNATIAVRKIGKYLTVLVTVPGGVLEGAGEQDAMQLCIHGCHHHERLDKPGSAAFTDPAMTKDKAQRICRMYNVTDYYLDSCIFDLVTTGDVSFGRAAAAAQEDLRHHDPVGAQRLQNCSDPPCVWDPNHGTTPRPSLLAVVALTSLLLITQSRMRY